MNWQEWLLPFVALAAMEIVLGIDNIVFLTIVTSRLPDHQQPFARRLGLGLALAMRILLLLCIRWIMQLTAPVFHLSDLGIPVELFANGAADPAAAVAEMNVVSWKDLILLAGGLFLIGKSVHEIHVKLEGSPQDRAVSGATSFASALIQIALLDMVFSLDSVITAIGMADRLGVMIAAVIVAVVVMLVFAESVSRFVSRHPTLKMLALSFLILIGVMLVAEAVGTHFDKGYIYFAMAFALLVEFLNLRVRSLTHAPPVG